MKFTQAPQFGTAPPAPSSWDHPSAGWRKRHPGDLAIVTCPEGHRTRVNEKTHRVVEGDALFPSYTCTVPGCTFHDMVQLEGYAPRVAEEGEPYRFGTTAAQAKEKALGQPHVLHTLTLGPFRVHVRTDGKGRWEATSQADPKAIAALRESEREIRALCRWLNDLGVVDTEHPDQILPGRVLAWAWLELQPSEAENDVQRGLRTPGRFAGRVRRAPG